MTEKKKKLLKLLHKRIPITLWLSNYNTDMAIADLIAGLTVGLTVMPQSLAYASLAGLETQFGLYSAFMGCFIYAFFGGCKDITIGPTALMSLMTYQQVIKRNSDYAVLLCFLTGCIMLIMAPFRLGVLVEFISQPVTVGFTAATSIIIVVSQIKGLLGLSFISEGFVQTLKMIGLHIHETQLWDTVMGVTCIIFLLLMRKLKEVNVVDKLKPTKKQKALAKFLWIFSLSRNVLVVIICSLIAYYLDTTFKDNMPIKLTGHVVSGLPSFQLPPFSTTVNNQTYHFTEMLSHLGSSILIVPIIAVLGNVAIAKAFATGGSLDASQELLTLGLCNLFGSFVSSMPITGSFSRSAVNHASGVKTPFGGIYTGILILLALGCLTPHFYYIPKASLAAVIISAVIFMIEYEVIKPMWQASKKDLLPMTVTFVVCLVVGVELGILIGVTTNIFLLLSHSARPHIAVEKAQASNYVVYMNITPSGSIYFPGVEHLRNVILSVGKSGLPVVINCSLMQGIDFTTAKGIALLLSEFDSRQQLLIIFNALDNILLTLKPICDKNLNHFKNQEELHSFILENYKIGLNDEINQASTNSLKDIENYQKDEKSLKENLDCNEPLLITKSKVVTIVSSNC